MAGNMNKVGWAFAMVLFCGGVSNAAMPNKTGGKGKEYSRALHDAIAATYPACYDLPNVVAVAATTATDSMATFSQYGRHTVHVAAPGSAIYSTSPGNRYATYSGTSMAAPHVTGLAALIKASKPATDWRGIKNLLLTGGNPLPSLTGKTVTGRQIDAFGSLTCIDSRLFSSLHFPASVTPGVPTTLSALSINCDAPLGPVTVTLSSGVLYELKDDGISPDLIAGDGVFSATFTPTRSNETFYFSSPAGSEQVVTTAPRATAPFAAAAP